MKHCYILNAYNSWRVKHENLVDTWLPSLFLRKEKKIISL